MLAVVAALIVVGCGPSSSATPPPGASAGATPGTPASALVPTPPGGTPGSGTGWASGPRPTPPSLVELCRRTIFMHPDGGPRLTDQERRDLRIVLQHGDQGNVYLIFATGTRDATCTAQSYMGFPSISAYLWGAPFPSRLSADRLLAVGPTGGDSSLGVRYAWGAVGPGVARVTIGDGAGATEDGVIQGSYFLALLHTRGGGGIMTIVAYDAAGREVGRGP